MVHAATVGNQWRSAQEETRSEEVGPSKSGTGWLAGWLADKQYESYHQRGPAMRSYHHLQPMNSYQLAATGRT